MNRIAAYRIPLVILIVVAAFLGTTNSCSLHAQTTADSTQRLASLCKIWGFLKYYHPAVASGKYDWDSMLVHQYIPKVLQADTKEKLSSFYIETINQLGKPAQYPLAPKQEPNASENKYLQWFSDSVCFTPELMTLLQEVRDHRYTKTNYYAGPVDNTNNVQFNNERVYPGKDHSSGAMRLLSLYRYWNAVEYFSPYKYLTDHKWETVPAHLALRFYNTADTNQYQLLLQELVALLNDSHGSMATPAIQKMFAKRPPFQIKTIDGIAVVDHIYSDSLALLDDIMVGDIITSIDDKSIAEVTATRRKYATGSNPPTVQTRIDRHLLSGEMTTAQISVKRNGQERPRLLHRYDYSNPVLYMNKPDDTVYKILDDDIGYINLGLLEPKDVDDVMDKLANTHTLVIDVRNYPKGTMYALCSRLAGGRREFVTFTYPDYDMPGSFLKQEGYSCGSDKAKKVYKGKVIVLVNESTQSHAEFTVMALKTRDNVTVIGSQTAGADGNVSKFIFPGGYETYITGLGVFYPDGTPTQRIGIVPDIEVKLTVAGIQQHRDEVLEKAIEIARESGRK